MIDRKILRILNGAIAMRGPLKKKVARNCGISPGQLSTYLHDDATIPFTVYEALIRELNLAGTLATIRAREAAEGYASSVEVTRTPGPFRVHGVLLI
jgi:hypothetical protein